jgi:hypothetical protein
MLLLTLLLASTAAEADQKPLPKNIVLADVGLHVVGLGYQRSFTPQVALQLSGSLYVPWTQSTNFLGLAGSSSLGDLTGLVARLRLFIYPDARAPTGFWLSPFVQAGLANETRDAQRQQGFVWAAGVSAGWGWLFFGHLHLALGLGVQFHAAEFPRGPGFERFYPQVEANLGWAF